MIGFTALKMRRVSFSCREQGNVKPALRLAHTHHPLCSAWLFAASGEEKSADASGNQNLNWLHFLLSFFPFICLFWKITIHISWTGCWGAVVPLDFDIVAFLLFKIWNINSENAVLDAEEANKRPKHFKNCFRLAAISYIRNSCRQIKAIFRKSSLVYFLFIGWSTLKKKTTKQIL